MLLPGLCNNYIGLGASDVVPVKVQVLLSITYRLASDFEVRTKKRKT